MNKKTIEPETMWAIYNPDYGFYIGTFPTKRGMIYLHTQGRGISWAECRKDGDIAVKVTISAAKPNSEKTNKAPIGKQA
jgi:hypothetical protein